MKVKIIGSGIFGCTCARILAEAGVSVDVVESRDVVGGNCSTYDQDGIEVHKYGSHIFHTSDEKTWKFVNRFSEFNQYRHQVLAVHDGKTYFLPFGLQLLNSFYGKALMPEEVNEFMDSVRQIDSNPANLEEQAIALIGKDLYEAFVKNYTKKQWQKDPKELDPSIIRRIPVRTNYDISYFSDKWQGIPLCGYQKMFENMLGHENIRVTVNVKYSKDDLVDDAFYDKIIYTGPLDELFEYEYGELAWRSLKFETRTLDISDFQGTSVVNYVDELPEYTRIHEFKHYHPERAQVQQKTIIQYEYPQNWRIGLERFYPVNNAATSKLQIRYLNKVAEYNNLIIGGRLGLYRYFDMDDAIIEAFKTCSGIIKA